MRVAVMGHVEWVEFLVVGAPLATGAILHATDGWSEPAGGGAVAAVELARLAGSARLFTAVGDDPTGRRIRPELARHGVAVEGPTRPEPHRRAITLVDPAGERTIVVVGPAQAVRGGEVAPGPLDAAYFCHGDADALREARAAARVLVATARVLPVLQAAGVRLDALVQSAADPRERYADGDLDPAPALVATTEGAAGGRWRASDGRSGRWEVAPLLGPPVDAYGCGDSFAAGLAFALGRGDPPDRALAFAATRGAAALCRRGAHGPVGDQPA